MQLAAITGCTGLRWSLEALKPFREATRPPGESPGGRCSKPGERLGGQGRGRTADLPIFRVRSSSPSAAGWRPDRTRSQATALRLCRLASSRTACYQRTCEQSVSIGRRWRRSQTLAAWELPIIAVGAGRPAGGEGLHWPGVAPTARTQRHGNGTHRPAREHVLGGPGPAGAAVATSPPRAHGPNKEPGVECRRARRWMGPWLSLRKAFTVSATRTAASAGGSCSQTRSTVHPSVASRASVSASRRRFMATLSAQKAALVLATVWCCGQPCQKQPSRNTASRMRGNTKSAVRRTERTGRRPTKYLSPSACTARRNASSGLVSRPVFACIDLRTPSEDAHDLSDNCSITFGAPTWSLKGEHLP